MSSPELSAAAYEEGDIPWLQNVLEETESDVGSEPLGSEGETALHVACAYGHLGIVQYLVTERGYFTSLHLNVAWDSKHWEVVEFLLSITEEDVYAMPGELCTEAFFESCICGYKALTRVTARMNVTKWLVYGMLPWSIGYFFISDE